jgi:hypothetical protein
MNDRRELSAVCRIQQTKGHQKIKVLFLLKNSFLFKIPKNNTINISINILLIASNNLIKFKESKLI